MCPSPGQERSVPCCRGRLPRVGGRNLTGTSVWSLHPRAQDPRNWQRRAARTRGAGQSHLHAVSPFIGIRRNIDRARHVRAMCSLRREYDGTDADGGGGAHSLTTSRACDSSRPQCTSKSVSMRNVSQLCRLGAARLTRLRLARALACRRCHPRVAGYALPGREVPRGASVRLSAECTS